MLDNMKERITKFQDFIGYKFTNEQLLEEALTTPGLGNELGKPDYEFLETLGDAVIKIIFILKLYHHGIKDPGDITKIKASLESDKTLRKVASRMNLENFIFKSENQTVKGTRILADVFEAICGALFLDSNHSTKLVEEKMIDPFYEDFEQSNIDPLLDKKNELLEFLQEKFKTSIIIKLDYIKSGFEHDPRWIARKPQIRERFTKNLLIKLPKDITSKEYSNKKDAERDIYLQIFNYLTKKK